MILNIAQDKVFLVVLYITEAFIEANMANSHYNLLVRKIHLEKQRRIRTCVSVRLCTETQQYWAQHRGALNDDGWVQYL